MTFSRGRPRAARQHLSLSSISSFLAALVLVPSPARALDITPAPAANLDFSRLGKVGIAGDFTGVSLYEYQGQSANTVSGNDSESLLAQLPNGAFASLASSDASIRSMCTYTGSNGDVAGVIIGGNFTSLNGKESRAIALFNPDTGEVTALDDLEGQVNAVYCDQDTNKVYVGGNFKKEDSMNAISWSADDGWTDLPFAGFNGPVSSITRASNGHIIFGGSFTGLGNTTTSSTPDEQVINLSDADITSTSSTTTAGFSDPRNIICKTDSVDGAGNTWLLADRSPGSWQASFGFGFRPTKLRLRNTHQDGRGTKTWRFTVIPDTGILNFTYVDPKTNEERSCTSECPLSDDPDVPFQDFTFVNSVGMDGFRIDISDFYGAGGGLNGIELFEEDISAFAINRFNEPSCARLATGASATATGPWREAPSAQSGSMYLTSQLQDPITEDSASIVFFPNIKDSGNYSVNMYTPGCIGDGTCGSRGQVNVTGVMSKDNKVTFSTSLYQTNNFDKYDQIYFGFIDASSTSFRPSVTITPLAGQSLNEMVFVAQRVGFSLISSSGGLNGLFDYDPEAQEIDESDLSSSAVNKLSSDFSGGSKISSVASSGDVIYVGGDFSSSDAHNVISINSEDERIASLDGGLDGAVAAILLDGSMLYVGGKFSKARGGDVNGLNNVAAYDTDKNSWVALGAGLNGNVHHVAALKITLGDEDAQTAIAFSGDFTECLEFDSNPASEVSRLAVWVPSQNNWLQNLDQTVPAYSGLLTASILDLPDIDALYAGSVAYSQVGASGAATLTDGTLGRFPVKIHTQSASTSGSSKVGRRELLSPDNGIAGVVAGTFYEGNNKDMTILAGRFSAELSDGTVTNNLVIIDSSDNDKVIGLDSDIGDNSTFSAVAVRDGILYAGGLVTGTVSGDSVNGLLAYNLDSNSFPNQPPPLSGGNSSVSAIAVQPKTGDILVGGSFTQAGSLPCPGVCIYDPGQTSWRQPGVNIQGDVHSMIWTSDTVMVVGGSLTVNGSTDTPLAMYYSETQSWDTYPDADSIPGPVVAMTLGSSDGNQIWIAGHAKDTGSVFIMKHDGTGWLTAPKDVLPQSIIRSMQVFSLTEKHDATDLLPERQSLVLVGSIGLPDFGKASAAVFDGQSFQPYALTTNSGDSASSMARFFTQKQDFFTAGGDDMPLVFVVLICLAISLGLMLIIVLAGIVLDRMRKKREGYMPAPTSMIDRSSGMRRVPPSQLFEGLGRERPNIPQV
ncbi:related to Pst1p [Cephalotrichum gorgonifer]|uniref:Related to Pst1p n=1 Tax=Cephalotrichum gorgonifer TaxID=2041049 RepID=A0AAE8MNX9_9PEZI|nr:related to Pst1p [Cephalotrichum gorgonifer]